MDDITWPLHRIERLYDFVTDYPKFVVGVIAFIIVLIITKRIKFNFKIEKISTSNIPESLKDTAKAPSKFGLTTQFSVKSINRDKLQDDSSRGNSK